MEFVINLQKNSFTPFDGCMLYMYYSVALPFLFETNLRFSFVISPAYLISIMTSVESAVSEIDLWMTFSTSGFKFRASLLIYAICGKHSSL